LVAGGKEAKRLIKRSKVHKLLEQVKAAFPDNTWAYKNANWALQELSKG